MPKGYALCIGLNSVNPDHYGGWDGKLYACEADARSMHRLLKQRGFSVACLLTQSATRAEVLSRIKLAASVTKPGDTFVLTNSSHGGQLPDLNGDESDAMDETMCMFDGEIVDDELYDALAAFPEGSRVLVVSDSCHSGTVARVAHIRAAGVEPGQPVAAWRDAASRALPPDVARDTYTQNQAFYDDILARPELRDARARVKASVLLLGACQDNQTAADGVYNGLFTSMLLQVWQGGAFGGNYRRFRDRIAALMPPDQTPSLFWATPSDATFAAKTPFTI